MQKYLKIPKEYDLVINAPFGSVGISSHGMQVDIVFLNQSVNIKREPSKIALQIAAQIEGYLINPNSNFNLPLVFKGTPFQRKVWGMISAIPSGQTRTYGEIAQQLGSGPRAVANACGANHLPLVVPCHRVVAKTSLGGFMRGLDEGVKIKKWLLKHEGADKFQDWLKSIVNTV
ncbi:MAG: cysteine methyltransferase [Methylophilaceae bacterium 17-44-8]|jgi:methylated-DNA-[protein]-cysteine S-methyltransferase|nr:MAG: cysteine methyltransferase [Methylophilales bacterium 28-44-11]OYY99263.1 MAG: cysteine methyltransferase [Methylophilales bacterium 16-45-7]OZA06168.1 MAG: cysteine methyltransferase [Methylophilaceae bacterium 17-44-8]